MKEFLDALAPYSYLIYMVLTALFSVAVFSMRSSFTPREETDKLKIRVAAIEERIKYLPDSETIHALSLQIEGLKGDLKATAPRFEMVDALAKRLTLQVDRIEEYLDNSVKPPNIIITQAGVPTK